MKKISVLSAVALTGLFFAATGCNAQIINVQFNADGNNSTPVGSLTAGVIPSAGWQNFSTGAYYAANNTPAGPSSPLLTSTGDPTAITVSTLSNGNAGQGDSPDNFVSPGDHALMSYGLFVRSEEGATGAIELDNLDPTLSYTLYMPVLAMWSFGPQNGFLATIGPDGDIIDATQAFYWSYDNSGNSYIQATATTLGASAPANYIEFSFTGSSTEVVSLYSPGGDNSDFYVPGFQLVTDAVPEPSIYMMLSAGLLVLVVLQRRKLRA